MVLAKVEKGGARSSAWITLHPAFPLIVYLLCGVGSFVVDFSTFFALTVGEGLDPLIAHLVSRPMGGLTCFLLNRRFTFRAVSASPLSVQMKRFWCVWGLSLALTEGLLAIFTRGIGMTAMPSKAIAELIAILFNFLALKHWTFQKPSSESDPA